MSEKVTEIVFILDKSGSMNSIRKDAIGGFNSFLSEQKKAEGKANLSLILFDHEVETVVDGVDINDVEELTDATYVPSGMTALVDAIGLGIDNLLNRFKKENIETDSVIFVIMTDGEENMSKEYNIKSVREKIEKLQKDKGYQFVFLGANIDVVKESNKFGIGSMASINFKATSDGMRGAYLHAGETVLSYRQADKLHENIKDSMKSDK